MEATSLRGPEGSLQEANIKGFENPPNQTLYIRNLNEKVKIDGNHILYESAIELKKALFEIFSPYGEILGVYAKKTYRMKGQAFVVFKELQSASEAMRCLQKTPLFGLEMNIHYAKDKSDQAAKMEGSYNEKVVPQRKQKREDDLKNLKEVTRGKGRTEPQYEQHPREQVMFPAGGYTV